MGRTGVGKCPASRKDNSEEETGQTVLRTRLKRKALQDDLQKSMPAEHQSPKGKNHKLNPSIPKVKVVEGRRMFDCGAVEAGTSKQSSSKNNFNENRNQPNTPTTGADNFNVDDESQFVASYDADGVLVNVDDGEDELFRENPDDNSHSDEDDSGQPDGLNRSMERVDSEVQFNLRAQDHHDDEINHSDSDGEAEAMRLMSRNPKIGKFFKNLIKEGIKEGIQASKGVESPGKSDHSNEVISQAETVADIQMDPLGPTTPVNKKAVNQGKSPVKSPSDTTLYVPALRQLHNQNESEGIIEKISNFVEGIRFDSQRRVDRRSTSPKTLRPRQPHPSPPEEPARRDREMPPGEELNAAAKNMVLGAERFNAGVEKPKGNDEFFIQGIDKVLRNPADSTADDDDYFYLACHVDLNTKQKIEQGEFIELEKLLPK